MLVCCFDSRTLLDLRGALVPNWDAEKGFMGVFYLSPLYNDNYFWDLPKCEKPEDAYEYQEWYSSGPIVILIEIMFFILIPHLDVFSVEVMSY